MGSASILICCFELWSGFNVSNIALLIVKSSARMGFTYHVLAVHDLSVVTTDGKDLDVSSNISQEVQISILVLLYLNPHMCIEWCTG